MKFLKLIFLALLGPALFFLLVLFIPQLNYLKGLFAFGKVYSRGERVGHAVEIRQTGLFWKTTEVLMAITQTGASVSVWTVSIDQADPNRSRDLDFFRNSLLSGVHLRVEYEERIGALPWRAATPYLCRKVEVHRGIK